MYWVAEQAARPGGDTGSLMLICTVCKVTDQYAVAAEIRWIAVNVYCDMDKQTMLLVTATLIANKTYTTWT